MFVMQLWQFYISLTIIIKKLVLKYFLVKTLQIEFCIQDAWQLFSQLYTLRSLN